MVAAKPPVVICNTASTVCTDSSGGTDILFLGSSEFVVLDAEFGDDPVVLFQWLS